MIVYKVELPVQLDANAKIKDMDPVLAEIATSLRLLQDALNQHEASFSTPSVSAYRDNIQKMIPEAIRLARLIHTQSQKLASVSKQASKQLTEFEDQIKTALTGIEAATTGDTITQAANSPGRAVHRNNLFQR